MARSIVALAAVAYLAGAITGAIVMWRRADRNAALPGDVSVYIEGRCSTFGGPWDGREAGNSWSVLDDEGLALWSMHERDQLLARGIILEDGVDRRGKGLARQLDPRAHYVAARWPGWGTKRRGAIRLSIRRALVHVQGVHSGWAATGWPVDYGPHESTGRAVDLSPGLAEAIGVTTGQRVVLRTK